MLDEQMAAARRAVEAGGDPELAKLLAIVGEMAARTDAVEMGAALGAEAGRRLVLLEQWQHAHTLEHAAATGRQEAVKHDVARLAQKVKTLASSVKGRNEDVAVLTADRAAANAHVEYSRGLIRAFARPFLPDGQAVRVVDACEALVAGARRLRGGRGEELAEPLEQLGEVVSELAQSVDACTAVVAKLGSEAPPPDAAEATEAPKA